MKQRLTEGNPIIVFIRIPEDTHYAVVAGYDEQHIYLVDSLAENANASDTQYNRVLTTENFEAVWKTGTLLPDNIYITSGHSRRDTEKAWQEAGEQLLLGGNESWHVLRPAGRNNAGKLYRRCNFCWDDRRSCGWDAHSKESGERR